MVSLHPVLANRLSEDPRLRVVLIEAGRDVAPGIEPDDIADDFPRAFAKVARKLPNLMALRDRVAARKRLRVYLESDRRVPLNERGIFRPYPELDADQ